MAEAAAVEQVAVTIKAGDGMSAATRKRRRHLKYIFIALAALSIIINLDGGAVPAALLHIENTFELSGTLVGCLGMFVYQGIALGSLCVGPVTQRISPRRATQATLILNTAATFGFGASQSAGMLLTFRILIGLLQAIPAVYFPVWVDEFAPEDSATVWMAVVQAGAPLGIMFGYVFSGVLTSNVPEGYVCPPTSWTCEWRYAFFLQSGVLVFFSLASFFLPAELYDIGAKKDDDADGEDAASARSEGMEESRSAASVSVSSQAMSVASTRPSMSGRERDNSMSQSLLDAFTPLGARRTIGDANAYMRFSKVPEHGGAVSATPASPQDAERKRRMEDRLRRCSSTPLDLPPGGIEAAPEPNTPGAASNASSAGGGAAGEAPAPRPRLTKVVFDESAGGMARPTVVSAVDLFSQHERYSRKSARLSKSGSSGSSNGGSKKAFKPTLQTLESGTNLAVKSSTKEGGGGEAAADDDDDDDDAPSTGSPLMLLATNGVYVCTVCSLSALFFVVTGIQFWVTKYIIQVIGEGQGLVVLAFGITSICAPLLGVFAGGTFIDKIGGYKGASALATTLKWCFIFEVCAASAAICTAFIPRMVAASSSFHGFLVCVAFIAVTLVFGGAVIPAATGVIVSAVAPELRQLSSAGSIFVFQQFGYAIAPFLSGAIGQAVAGSGSGASTGDDDLFAGLVNGTSNATAPLYNKEETIVAFWVCMLWSLVGVVFMFGAWQFARRGVQTFDVPEPGQKPKEVEAASVSTVSAAT